MSTLKPGVTLIECCIYIMSLMLIMGLLISVLSAFYKHMQSHLHVSNTFAQALVAWRVLEYDIATATELSSRTLKDKTTELFIQNQKQRYKWHIKKGYLVRSVWSDKKRGYISNSLAGNCKNFIVVNYTNIVNFAFTVAYDSKDKTITGIVMPRIGTTV